MLKHTVFYGLLSLILLFSVAGGFAAPAHPIKTFPSGMYSHDIFIDKAGGIWVTNANVNTVTKLNPSGQVERVIPNVPTNTGKYDTGNIIIQDLKGNIDILGDQGLVDEFDSSGAYLRQFQLPSVNNAISLAINPAGGLWAAGAWSYQQAYAYVVDDYNTVCDCDGKHCRQVYVGSHVEIGIKNYWGENIALMTPDLQMKGQLNMDGADWPAEMASDADGNMWITHHTRNVVLKMDPTGTTIATVDVGNRSEGIAIDPSGNVWVATENHDIVKISSTGQILSKTKIDTKNWKYGADRIVADQSGNVWVANPQNAVIELNGAGDIVAAYPMPNPVALTIDNHHNVWVVNNIAAGNNLWEIVNAATSAQYAPAAKIEAVASN